MPTSSSTWSATHAPKVSLIVTSHQHFDHWQALEAVAAATGAPTAAHQIDAEPLPVTPDRLLAGGDTIEIGELTFDVIHLRGHTPGSVALALDGPATGGVTQLFTGDCLFPGGVGKTWQPGDFDQLIDDVSTRVFDRFGDDDGGVPRPRRRHHTRRRATASSGVARAGLVRLARSAEGLRTLAQRAKRRMPKWLKAFLLRHSGEQFTQGFALFTIKP